MSIGARFAQLEKAFNKKYPESYQKSIAMIYFWGGVYATVKVGSFVFGGKKKPAQAVEAPQTFSTAVSTDNKYGFQVPSFDTIEEWSANPENIMAWEKWVETPGNLEKWEKGLA